MKRIATLALFAALFTTSAAGLAAAHSCDCAKCGKASDASAPTTTAPGNLRHGIDFP